MEKIKNIEFLRIIGCMAVVLFHFFKDKTLIQIPGFDYLHCCTCNGNKAVDLFFILSGFFFILCYKNSTSIWDFVKKKIFRLYPVLLFTIIIPYSSRSLNKLLLTIFCLNGTSLSNENGPVGVFWYVSAMFWVLLLFIYLLKNYEKKNVDLFAAISIFISYGIIIHALDGKICAHTKYYYFINIGMLRALGGISAGYFIGKWYKGNIEKIKAFLPNLVQKVLFTTAEGYCLIFIIYYLIFHELHYKNQFIFILIFISTIVLFIVKKGFLSELFDNNISVFWGKYTYSMYMTHPIIIKIIVNFYKNNSTTMQNHTCGLIFCYLVIVILFSMFTYHLIEKPAQKFLIKRYLSK